MFPNIIKNALETCPASAIWLQLQQVFSTGNGNYPSDFRIKETDGAAKHPAELLNSCADLGGGHGHFCSPKAYLDEYMSVTMGGED